jgi:hypothetical protein
MAAAAVTVAAQPRAGELDAAVDRAADYVAAYQRTFVGVVAEETYRQQARGGRIRTDARGFPVEAATEHRDLKSDVLLVRAPAGDRWIQFRDVFEVDGKAVRDREERLSKLFLQPAADARQQQDAIAAASARYNIGGVKRDLNLPVLAPAVLQPDNRPWFAFTLGRRSADTIDLEYREQRGGTLVRTTGDQPMPASGKLTIDRRTGRVLATTLSLESAALRAQIDVAYANDPAVGMLVPREMREKYTTTDGSVVEGRATYAKYRRYQVKVDEAIGTVKK